MSHSVEPGAKALAVPSYVVSESEHQHFAARGYVILKNVLTEAEVARIRDRIDAILEGTVPVPESAFIVGAASKGNADDVGRRTLQVMATRFPIEDEVLAAFGGHPLLESLCSQLMGTDHAGIFQQQALVKPPRQLNPTPWHQDDFYFATAEPAITAWIPLAPVSVDNGTLRVVPGSHHRAVLDHVAAAGESDFKEVKVEIGPDDSVPILLNVGDVSFHHKRTLHGAFANQSDVRRIAIAQHYSGGNVTEMQQRWLAHSGKKK